MTDLRWIQAGCSLRLPKECQALSLVRKCSYQFIKWKIMKGAWLKAPKTNTARYTKPHDTIPVSFFLEISCHWCEPLVSFLFRCFEQALYPLEMIFMLMILILINKANFQWHKLWLQILITNFCR